MAHQKTGAVQDFAAQIGIILGNASQHEVVQYFKDRGMIKELDAFRDAARALPRAFFMES